MGPELWSKRPLISLKGKMEAPEVAEVITITIIEVAEVITITIIEVAEVITITIIEAAEATIII